MHANQPGTDVLLVDGYKGSRVALAALLRAESFQVRAVATVTDALAEIDQQPPSVMITELRLPRRDGIELIQAVSGDEDGAPVCPVIVTTGMAGSETLCWALGQQHPVLEARAAGAFAILSKPIDFNALLAAIHRAIRLCKTGARATRTRTPAASHQRFHDGVTPPLVGACGTLAIL